jgi:hypothetical protein
MQQVTAESIGARELSGRTGSEVTVYTGNSRYNETRYNGFHVITNAPTGTDLAP